MAPPAATADRCVTLATPATFYLPAHFWDPSFLPEEARQKFLGELIASDDIVRALECPEDGIAPCLNWDSNLSKHSRLYPLHTAGTGDCLLNAAFLATWGIQDHTQEATPQNTYALLRLALSLTLRHAGASIKERWLCERLQGAAGGGLTAATLHKLVALDREWEDVGVDAALPKRSLLPEHIFVLAQVLCRPIVVYGPDTIHGVQYPWHELHSGIYLPVLHPPAKCCRNPICMAYTAGHFSAVVTAAPQRIQAPASDSMTPLNATGVRALAGQTPRQRPTRTAPAPHDPSLPVQPSPSTPSKVNRQMWLAACMAAAKGEAEPLRAWRRAAPDVARQLTFEEASELNQLWQEREGEKGLTGKPGGPPAFLTGDDIEGLIIRYETWNVYETLAQDPVIDPCCLKRPASQLHLSTRSSANHVRRVARAALVVPPLEGALRCFVQLPQQPWSPPALWKEAWVEVDDRKLTSYDLSFGCKGARQLCLSLESTTLLPPTSLADWSAGVIAGAEQHTPSLRLWLKASDANLAHHWRSSLVERQLLAQIPAAPPSPLPQSSPAMKDPGFDSFVPLVESDLSPMKLRFLKSEEDPVQLLTEYLDCFGTAASSSVLCARQHCSPYPPAVAEFVHSYLEVLQQRLQAGTLTNGSVSVSSFSAQFDLDLHPSLAPAPFVSPAFDARRFSRAMGTAHSSGPPPTVTGQRLPPDRGMPASDLWYRPDLCFAANADAAALEGTVDRSLVAWNFNRPCDASLAPGVPPNTLTPTPAPFPFQSPSRLRPVPLGASQWPMVPSAGNPERSLPTNQFPIYARQPRP